MQQALALDPVSPNLNGLFGEFLIETRQFDKGLRQLQRTIELDPHQSIPGCVWDSWSDLAQRFPDAEEEFLEAERISPNTMSSRAGLAYTYGLEGRTVDAQRLLASLEVSAEQAGHPWLVCLVYIGLHSTDEAMRWLKRARDEGDFLFDIENPLVDPLRADSRFPELEQSVKAAREKQPPG